MAEEGGFEDSYKPAFLRKKNRRERLYFTDKDEMVDEETAQNDQTNYYHKSHMVEVDFDEISGADSYQNDSDLALIDQII